MRKTYSFKIPNIDTNFDLVLSDGVTFPRSIHVYEDIVYVDDVRYGIFDESDDESDDESNDESKVNKINEVYQIMDTLTNDIVKTYLNEKKAIKELEDLNLSHWESVLNALKNEMILNKYVSNTLPTISINDIKRLERSVESFKKYGTHGTFTINDKCIEGRYNLKTCKIDN